MRTSFFDKTSKLFFKSCLDIQIKRQNKVRSRLSSCNAGRQDYVGVFDQRLHESLGPANCPIDPGGGTVYKLCKKYGPSGCVEPITNIYLDTAEFSLFDCLPGITVQKDRHKLDRGAIDVYLFPDGPLYVYEIEFPSLDDAEAFTAPAYAGREITNEETYTGYALAVRGAS